jgi:osmotically inducible protein OsmC
MAGFTRTADAVWNGGGKDGRGTISTRSGRLSSVPYTAGMRFGEEPGTNPEELIGAALASCFSMALAFGLSGAGHTPEELRATAGVSIEPNESGGFTITRIALTARGRVPGIDDATFRRAAESAKDGCPVSRLLKGGAEITLDAQLEG